MADVRHLAGDIGPRLATGPAFREAARWVEGRFTELHYDVTRQTYPVPAGSPGASRSRRAGPPT